jgi:hypothetical protein
VADRSDLHLAELGHVSSADAGLVELRGGLLALDSASDDKKADGENADQERPQGRAYDMSQVSPPSAADGTVQSRIAILRIDASATLTRGLRG